MQVPSYYFTHIKVVCFPAYPYMGIMCSWPERLVHTQPFPRMSSTSYRSWDRVLLSRGSGGTCR